MAGPCVLAAQASENAIISFLADVFASSLDITGRTIIAFFDSEMQS
jgi:hypothetical protein